ncbi:unnamed protein product [Rhizopus stolonifer]
MSSYLKQLSWTPEDELESNSKNEYTGDTYIDPSLDSQSEYQLWEPFIDTTVNTKSVSNTGISLKKLQKSLVRHYTRVLPNFNQQSSLDCTELKIAGRCWSDPSTEYSSIYYRMKSRHDMRGNHIVMFLAPFLNKRGRSIQNWFVGEIVFFFVHKQNGVSRFLVFLNVMKKHSASEIDSHIPLIKKSRKPKQAVVAIEDILCPVGLVPSATKWFKVACNHQGEKVRVNFYACVHLYATEGKCTNSEKKCSQMRTNALLRKKRLAVKEKNSVCGQTTRS